MNATMYATVDTAINGNIRTPNHAAYNLLLVLNKETGYKTPPCDATIDAKKATKILGVN